VSVEEVDPASAAAVVAAMGEEGDLVSPRLARGCRCFAVRVQDQLAGYGWLSSGPEWIGELGLEIQPAATEAYIWNCVTVPVHRRRGLFRSLLSALISQARREGLSRLWIGTLDSVGVGAVAAAGFRPVLNVRVLDLPALRWLSLTGAEGADAVSVDEALDSLGAGVRLRGGPRRARRRRH
jgi:GNAT superfamily N-acetyltransferase